MIRLAVEGTELAVSMASKQVRRDGRVAEADEGRLDSMTKVAAVLRSRMGGLGWLG